jgi:hypothetical protein
MVYQGVYVQGITIKEEPRGLNNSSHVFVAIVDTNRRRDGRKVPEECGVSITWMAAGEAPVVYM